MNAVVITLAPEQLAILNEALINMPYKHAAPLIEAISSQIREQQQKAEVASNA